MEEFDVILRIAKAINALEDPPRKVNRWDLGCAEAAWNEMKAIAKEDAEKHAVLVRVWSRFREAKAKYQGPSRVAAWT